MSSVTSSPRSKPAPIRFSERMDAGRAQKLSALIERQSIAAVLIHADAAPEIAAAIRAGGARPMAMAQIEGETTDIVGVVEANLVGIADALKGGR